MRRYSPMLLAVLALMIAAAPASAAPRNRADGKLAEWKGTPTHVAGQSVVSKGELIYTDWLYDDYGPDLNGRLDIPDFRSNLAQTRGDFRYPDNPGRYGYNAADLRELRMKADSRGVQFLISLQTMKAADAAVATIAIDGDGSEATSLPLPGGEGVRAQGADRFITTWGTGARLTTPEGSTRLGTAVNLRENAIEVRVTNRALGLAAKQPRLWVFTGLHDGNGRFEEQQAGRAAVFNAGFREESWPRLDGGFSENEQAKALAGGDVTRFSEPVSIARLRHGRSDRPRVLPAGFYNRVFRSRLGLGEGIDLKGERGGGLQGVAGGPDPMFLSPWQPYGLYIPEAYDPRGGNQLTLVGHSLDVNHNQYKVVSPNLLKQLGDERRSVLITPLARGSDTWYLDSGLVDVLEAWDDVRRAYAIDDERTSIAGYSMGGYMTYRLGLLMPDRFARASSYVGPPAYYSWPYPLPVQSTPEWRVRANTNLIVANARNLPYEIVHGNGDELVPVGGVQQQADTFKARGNAYRFFRHSADDHLSFILNDEWSRTRDWLGNHRRVTAPVEVVYRRYPSMDLPKRGLRFDSAYWVSEIDVRDAEAEDDSGLVRAVSFGLGGNRPAARAKAPQPVAGPTTPGTLSEQELVNGDAIRRNNGFEVDLDNVGGAAFDLADMGLSARRRLAIRVKSDGPVRISLRARFPRVRVTSSDGRVPYARLRRKLRIDLPTGTTSVTVTPLRRK